MDILLSSVVHLAALCRSCLEAAGESNHFHSLVDRARSNVWATGQITISIVWWLVLGPMYGPRGKQPFSFFGSPNSVLCMGQGANNHFHVLVVLAWFRLVLPNPLLWILAAKLGFAAIYSIILLIYVIYYTLYIIWYRIYYILGDEVLLHYP
jgi:hypothetical protein